VTVTHEGSEVRLSQLVQLHQNFFSLHDDENYKTVLRDLTKTFDKAQADFGLNLANALKLWGIKRR
jgi:hypothetical protein